MKRPKFRLPQLSATRLDRHMAIDSSGQLAAQGVAAALLASRNGQFRHGDRTKAAIAEQRKFSALLKMLRAGLTNT
jgi:hypothetical protein